VVPLRCIEFAARNPCELRRGVAKALQRPDFADVAQLVEHFTRNEGVPGSSPGVGSEIKHLLKGTLLTPRSGRHAGEKRSKGYTRGTRDSRKAAPTVARAVSSLGRHQPRNDPLAEQARDASRRLLRRERPSPRPASGLEQVFETGTDGCQALLVCRDSWIPAVAVGKSMGKWRSPGARLRCRNGVRRCPRLRTDVAVSSWRRGAGRPRGPL
jgi:hypothetical protein